LLYMLLWQRFLKRFSDESKSGVVVVAVLELFGMDTVQRESSAGGVANVGLVLFNPAKLSGDIVNDGGLSCGFGRVTVFGS